MALVFDAPVGLDTLTFLAREVPTPNGLTLLNAFPTKESRTNKVDFAEITKRNRTARYRTFDGRLHITDRDTGTSASVSMIPLSDGRNTGEYERLQMLFAQVGGTNVSQLVDAIYQDVEDLTKFVYNRVELAWGDVLTDGILTVPEVGPGFEADFGVPGAHKVTAATLWSNLTGATVLTNLITWHDVYVATNGAPAGAIRTSQAVLRLVQRNKEIIDAIYGATAGRTYASFEDVNTLLGAHGLPPFAAPYDTMLEDTNDTLARVIPANRVLFTPADLGDLGYTAWGTTATALELVNSAKVDFSTEDANGVVAVIVKDGPPFRQYTWVDAVAMPVLSDARRLFIATVTA